MFIAIRTIAYATAFIGFLLVYLPARVLSWSGFVRPAGTEWPQILYTFLGMILCAAGALVALWCVSTFVWIGKGTPAPFDPPRRLVVLGPYRFVRNPMYMGAALALAGAALFYRSAALLVYASVFLLLTHLFVVAYEEPTLRRSFGPEYQAYCERVSRWAPRLKAPEKSLYPPGAKKSSSPARTA